jgi:hypothetical protein
MLRDLAQLAWTLTCDFHHCPECIDSIPEHVAVAMLVLAADMLALPLLPCWWDALWPDAGPTAIAAIVAPLVDMYASQRCIPPCLPSHPPAPLSSQDAPSTPAPVPTGSQEPQQQQQA